MDKKKVEGPLPDPWEWIESAAFRVLPSNQSQLLGRLKLLVQNDSPVNLDNDHNCIESSGE
jgi:hypothetical protein